MSKDLENYNDVGDMDDNYPFTLSDDYDYGYDDHDDDYGNEYDEDDYDEDTEELVRLG